MATDPATPRPPDTIATLDAAWADFRCYLPEDLDESDLIDMRVGFYTGARALLNILHDAAEMSAADADHQIEVLEAEISDWKTTVLETFNRGGDISDVFKARKPS